MTQPEKDFWRRLGTIEEARIVSLNLLIAQAPDDRASTLLMTEVDASARIVHEIAKQGRAASVRR